MKAPVICLVLAIALVGRSHGEENAPATTGNLAMASSLRRMSGRC